MSRKTTRADNSPNLFNNFSGLSDDMSPCVTDNTGHLHTVPPSTAKKKQDSIVAMDTVTIDILVLDVVVNL